VLLAVMAGAPRGPLLFRVVVALLMVVAVAIILVLVTRLTMLAWLLRILLLLAIVRRAYGISARLGGA
jgi:hypothetical protein